MNEDQLFPVLLTQDEAKTAALSLMVDDDLSAEEKLPALAALLAAAYPERVSRPIVGVDMAAPGSYQTVMTNVGFNSEGEMILNHSPFPKLEDLTEDEITYIMDWDDVEWMANKPAYAVMAEGTNHQKRLLEVWQDHLRENPKDMGNFLPWAKKAMVKDKDTGGFIIPRRPAP